MFTEKKISRFRNKFIGDRAFYAMLLGVAVPIMIQNGISNFVGMLDNIMVGRIGTEQMSGVSIVNQLNFIYFLCLFGGMGGVGIFTAQYYGNNDMDGVRHTFRYKIWLGVLVTAAAAVILKLFGTPLIQLYLNEGSQEGDLEATLQYALGYLDIILLSFPGAFILQIYASTLRECGETKVPMIAGVIAVFVNLFLNYVLIFGKLGFEAMGVNGAAYATVISRYIEMTIVIAWVHLHKQKNPYIVGMYKSLLVPAHLAKDYFIKGVPLLVNESLWSLGMSVLLQSYSLRGLNVIAAFNIANTINNLFNIVFIAMGDAVAIIVGQRLGAGKTQEARDIDNKIFFCAVSFSVLTGMMMATISGVFPLLYETNAEARSLASSIILVNSFCMPLFAFAHCAYFTLRSGGKTIITFLFDSVFTWVVCVPIAFVLAHYTDLHIIVILLCVSATDLIKCIVGFILVKKGVWINNIVSDK